MIPFRIYKHINCLDAAIIPIKSFYVKEKKLWKLRVKWVIVKNDKYVRDLGVSERIQITQEQSKDWKLVGTPDHFVDVHY